jgi:HAD superfamily hydrolase (TIGR01509 family)
MSVVFEAVLFDCDGVLVDSEVIATRALHRSLQDIDIVMSLDEVGKTFTGQSFAQCVALIEAHRGSPLPENFMEDNRRYFRELMERELVAMPGIKEVLQSLDVPYALVTNSQTRELDVKLTHTGLDSFFPSERRFDTETVGVAKPNPEIYQRAAAALGLNIKRCLIVEDSFPGVSAGVHSGATVWCYRPHLTQEELDEFGVTCVFTDWQQFIPLFKQAQH